MSMPSITPPHDSGGSFRPRDFESESGSVESGEFYLTDRDEGEGTETDSDYLGRDISKKRNDGSGGLTSGDTVEDGDDPDVRIEEKSSSTKDPAKEVDKTGSKVLLIAGVVGVTGSYALLMLSCAFPPAIVVTGPVAIALLVTSEAVVCVGIDKVIPDQSEQSDAASLFMSRFTQDCDSYHRVIKGFTTEDEREVPPTSLDEVLQSVDMEATSTLKDLDNSYAELLKITNREALEYCLTKKPKRFEAKETDFNKRQDEIKNMKLTDTEKSKLMSKGVPGDKIEHYETYWRNFMCLKEAAEKGGRTSVFFEPHSSPPNVSTSS